MKRSRPENFTHENFISMHSNKIFIHSNNMFMNENEMHARNEISMHEK